MFSFVFVSLLCCFCVSSETLIYSQFDWTNATEPGDIYARFPNGSTQFITKGDWPRLSPNKKLMLFKKTRHVHEYTFQINAELYCRDLETGEENFVSYAEDSVGYTFLADNRRILFDTMDHVEMYDKNGTQLGSYLPPENSIDSPNIHPFNDSLAILSDANYRGMLVWSITEEALKMSNMSLTSYTTAPLAQGTILPVWHPNGSFVASVNNSTNVLEFIYPTRREVQNSRVNFGGYFPGVIFSRDGNVLYATRFLNSSSQLVVVPMNAPNTFIDISPPTLRGNYMFNYAGAVCPDCMDQVCGPNLQCRDIGPCRVQCSTTVACDRAAPCGNNALCTSDSPGSYNCTCRPNYVGDPYIGCRSCGNGKCDVGLGEDCGSCPDDCARPGLGCNLCGDSKCDATRGENCTTCFADCGACVSNKGLCPGTPSCSGHGSCLDGFCSCSMEFSGPSCDQARQPIEVIKNDTGPSIAFQPQANSDMQFLFAIYEIREVDAANNVVFQLNLHKENYTIIRSSTTSATIPSYALSSRLSNKARLRATEVLFLNRTLSFSANTIKITASIQSWPFRTTRNKLWLLTTQNSSIEGVSNCQKDNQGYDGSGNLRFSQIQINNTILYGNFLEYASIDNRKKPLEVKVLSQSLEQVVAAIIVPFFFDSAIIDPDFSILINSENANIECGEKKSNNINKRIIIGIVVSVIGCALVISVIILGISKYKQAKFRKEFQLKSMAL